MAKIYKILFLVIILEITGTYIVYVESNQNYCDIDTCREKNIHLFHTGCFSRLRGLAYSCTDHYEIVSIHLDDEEKQIIVDRHNDLRLSLMFGKEFKGFNGPQPGAYFLPFLEWDDEIALLAEAWAHHCIPTIDSCRDVAEHKVNQLHHVSTYDEPYNKPTVKHIVDRWYDDIVNFDENKVINYTDDGMGNGYSQLVWSRTTKIGCGQITIGRKLFNPDEKEVKYTVPPLDLSEKRYGRLLFCNYAPAGNIDGEMVYTPYPTGYCKACEV